MSGPDLNPIKARQNEYMRRVSDEADTLGLEVVLSAQDVPALLAEVDRLRAVAEAARALCRCESAGAYVMRFEALREAVQTWEEG